jgi:flavin-dependent dehydrogenase
MIGTHATAARRFHSPFNEKSAEVFRHTPSIVYKWEDFIELLLNRLKETSTELRTSSLVKKPIYNGRLCVGVELENGEKIYGNTILACDGHQSQLGRSVGVPYETINCPIIKRKISNFTSDYGGFEYFLLPVGTLEFAPKFPPATLFIFPHGNQKAEAGLMIFTPEARKLSKVCEMPSEEEIQRVWKILIAQYPRFSDLMKGTKTEFEGMTEIATGGVYPQPLPKMGLVLVGATIGFLEASGGSGITSSMKMAHWVIEYIMNNQITKWTPARSNRFIRDLKKKKFWKHIIRNNKKTRRALNFLFVKMQAPEKINKRWGILKRFL